MLAALKLITLFDYDLISVCETNLNESLEISDPLLKDDTFLAANHPGGASRVGVGLFYKSSLPVFHRQDLSFDESVVIELKFGRKIFFTVLYRSPASKFGSTEFALFLPNFKNLHSHATFFAGE